MIPNVENFKKLGLSGVLVYLIAAALPFIAVNVTTWKQQSREDVMYSDSAWKDFSQELRIELRDLKDELKATQAQLWALKGELKFLRQAESSAPVAIWELNSLHEVRWFNQTFKNIIWRPTGINPDSTIGLSWGEIYPAKIAAPYIRDDNEVRKCRCPVTNSDMFTVDITGKRTYWHTIKWPIIQDQIYLGLKGLAYPIDGEHPLSKIQ